MNNMWKLIDILKDILTELRSIRELLSKSINYGLKEETDFDKTIKQAFDNKPML